MSYTAKDWNLDDPITEADLDHIETGIATLALDSGWVTTGITAASGWTLGSYNYRKIGSTVWINVPVTRSGGAITTAADGNITDSTCFTLPAGYRPTVAFGGSTGSGTRQATFRIDTDGTVDMVAAANGEDIADNDLFYVWSCFPI